MLRKISMAAAALLIWMPPGIEGMSLRATHAGDHLGSNHASLAGFLLGPMDMVLVCACLTVLCLVNARHKMRA